MAIVKTVGLRAYYVAAQYGITRTVKAVDGVSIEVNENEILGIAGESGCGKSTLLRVLVGMVRPPLAVLEGRVIYSLGGREVDPLLLPRQDLDQIRWRFMSYIPQGSMSVLNPTRTIEKTFFDVIRIHGANNEARGARELMKDHVKALGLPLEVLKSYPHQLSGGMRQRVTIALATILQPEVIFADEPTTALDVVVQRGIIQLLRKIQAEYQNTLVVVTHDMAVHANIADRIAIMYGGRIVELGKTENIFKKPQHPYTRYLIESLPRIGDKSPRPIVPGSPPSLSNPPRGCTFHPRCPYVIDRCKEEAPRLNEVNGHRVACFLFNKGVQET